MARRQTAKDRAFVRKIKTLIFPAHDSPFTMGGKRYVTSLARYRGDPEAIVGSPAEAKEVLKRQGRWGPHTSITAQH